MTKSRVVVQFVWCSAGCGARGNRHAKRIRARRYRPDQGIVTDPTGAVVPGAKITVTSLRRGFSRVTVSGGDGSFLIPLMPPSHYQAEVLALNF